jgi:hypothetical protein
MARVEIDWSTAEVRDGELTVALSEPPTSRWRKRFRTVLPRLERSGEAWGEVATKKDRIVVGDVDEGAEDEVRHFVESLVLEANAIEAEQEQEQPEDADARMTAAFRTFAAERDEAA